MLFQDEAIALAKRTARSCSIPHAVIADLNNLFYIAKEPVHGWHWLVIPKGHKIVGIADVNGNYE